MNLALQRYKISNSWHPVKVNEYVSFLMSLNIGLRDYFIYVIEVNYILLEHKQ